MRRRRRRSTILKRLGASDMMDALRFLRCLPPDLRVEELFDAISSIKIEEKAFERVLARARECEGAEQPDLERERATSGCPIA